MSYIDHQITTSKSVDKRSTGEISPEATQSQAPFSPFWTSLSDTND